MKEKSVIVQEELSNEVVKLQKHISDFEHAERRKLKRKIDSG